MEENRFENTPEGNNFDGNTNNEKKTEEEKEQDTVYAFRWNYTEQDSANAEKAKKERRNGMKTYAIVMTAAFLLCFAILVSVIVLDGFANITETKIIEHVRTIFVREYDDESGVLTIPEIADKVAPCVVEIRVTYDSGTSVGTGIVMSEDGYIATNAYVVENAESVKVIFYDGNEVDANIIGVDSLSDLAVIDVEGDGYKKAEFGNSDELIVGEIAVAIGTPVGTDLSGTVTFGIISAINRDVKIFDEQTGTLQKTMTLIQTSASMSKGNNGGPLINDRGQIIGINTLNSGVGYDGIGFAIPINGALEILNRIIENGGDISENNNGIAKKRVIIGIKGGAVSKAQGAPATGVYVAEISEGYDAENHLMVEDIIVGIDGNEVLQVSDISAAIENKAAGDKVTLKVYRDGRLFDVDVALDYEK